MSPTQPLPVSRWLLLALALLLTQRAEAELGVSVLANFRFGDELVAAGTDVDVDDGNGAALSLHYFTAADSAYELWWSRTATDARTDAAETELQQDSLQFGGRKYWLEEPFRPYVGATVGVIRLQPDVVRNERETRPAFTLFIGSALPIAEHWQLVAELRWLGTIFSSDTTIRCDDVDCRWQIKSGTWSQYDFGVGVSGQF